jgi:hypothetical protein
LAQALILALEEDKNQPVATDRLRLAGLVKGVVFMGTPFWGSLNATTAAPFVTALGNVNPFPGNSALGSINPFPVNSTLVKSLSANSLDLATLVSHFSQITATHGIEIKIFYESRPLTLSGLVSESS